MHLFSSLLYLQTSFLVFPLLKYFTCRTLRCFQIQWDRVSFSMQVHVSKKLLYPVILPSRCIHFVVCFPFNSPFDCFTCCRVLCCFQKFNGTVFQSCYNFMPVSFCHRILCSNTPLPCISLQFESFRSSVAMTPRLVIDWSTQFADQISLCRMQSSSCPPDRRRASRSFALYDFRVITAVHLALSTRSLCCANSRLSLGAHWRSSCPLWWSSLVSLWGSSVSVRYWQYWAGLSRGATHPNVSIIAMCWMFQS